MDALVWVLTGIFMFDVVVVVVLGLRVEVTRRRDRREVRELERLYEAPPASSPTTVQGGGVRIHGRLVAVGVHDGLRRRGMVRALSFVLIVASIAALIVAALLSPADRVETRGMTPDDTIVRMPVVGPRFDPSEPSDAMPRTAPSPPSGEEQVGGDARIVGGDSVGHSGGGETVPETVTAHSTSATSILLEWAPVAAATGYRIDRSVEDASSGLSGWVTIATTTSEVSTHRDTDLEASTTYSYRVTAQLEEGEAPASEVVSVTTAPPAAPVLTAASAGGVITLEWDDVEGAVGFRVERATNGESDWTVIATTEAGVIAISDGNVTAGASYQYRVIAEGQGQDSPFSNIVVVNLAAPAGEETPTPDAVPAEPDAIDPNVPPLPEAGPSGELTSRPATGPASS